MLAIAIITAISYLNVTIAAYYIEVESWYLNINLKRRLSTLGLGLAS